MGGRVNHCRGEGLLQKACWALIPTCLLGLSAPGALAETPGKGRARQSCWCCATPILRAACRREFSFLELFRASAAGREAALTLPCPEPWWAGGQQDVACILPCIPALHPVPASQPFISGMASPQVLVLLGVFSEPSFVTIVYVAAPETP